MSSKYHFFMHIQGEGAPGIKAPGAKAPGTKAPRITEKNKHILDKKIPNEILMELNNPKKSMDEDWRSLLEKLLTPTNVIPSVGNAGFYNQRLIIINNLTLFFKENFPTWKKNKLNEEVQEQSILDGITRKLKFVPFKKIHTDDTNFVINHLNSTKRGRDSASDFTICNDDFIDPYYNNHNNNNCNNIQNYNINNNNYNNNNNNNNGEEVILYNCNNNNNNNFSLFGYHNREENRSIQDLPYQLQPFTSPGPKNNPQYINKTDTFINDPPSKKIKIDDVTSLTVSDIVDNSIHVEMHMEYPESSIFYLIMSSTTGDFIVPAATSNDPPLRGALDRCATP